MLDADTKRRIDDARDILVGKIPDPKSQVEQITIALTYKLMDDMDAVSEELGGLRSHFSGDFAKYRWANLTRPDAAGDEILQLYVEAISRMRENPNLPPLFRSIFNNAFLPYGDPETLRAFLKAIAEFDYAKSEPLGDAFEYLLSSLGSQGDAGQFLTPRHVIDFIVAAIDPKKYERVLDPACGTAGFLISAYRHIQAANRDSDGISTLDPKDKQRLADNFSGYDISPDMVRLSLVNMYLHGLLQPRIHEYDTLTNEDRWNELADVILANPPFMSPKGGIKPHERFAIQSKRSEVLFVDYIADHLTPRGRAGVIVPEGIVFQSQNAHRSLREKLVDEFLVAVVSLPAGVFKPYSGVKTSILILDKPLSRRTDSIAFFKVENDGFELGDQRRPIDANDLPQAQAELAEYLNRLRNRAPLDGFNPSLGLIVKKARIAADGEYFLNGERYREVKETRNSKYSLVPFQDVCTLEYGASLPQKNRVAGPYPVMGSNGISGYHNEFLIEGPSIVVGRKGSAGEVTYIERDCFPIDTTYYVKIVNENLTDIRYLYYVLKSLNLPALRAGAGIPGLNRNDVYREHKIPLPPLEVQREMVAEIAGYQRVIDGARAVVENWRPRVVVDPAWPVARIGGIATIKAGNPAPQGNKYFNEGVFPFVRTSDVGKVHLSDNFTGAADLVNQKAVDELRLRLFPTGTILFPKSGASTFLNHRVILGEPAYVSSHLAAIIPDAEKASAQFIYSLLCDIDARDITPDQAYPSLRLKAIGDLEIPLPPLETQRAIAAELDAERALVDANRELIRRFEAKIEAAVGRVWGAAPAR